MVTTARRAGHYGVPAGWSRRAHELPVASVIGTGESRRRQALPAVLATVVGARTGGRVLRLVVGCSDRWSSARTSGRVLGLVVGCSDLWSGAQTGGRVLGWWLCHGGGVASTACVLATTSKEPREAYNVQGLGDGHGQHECAVLVCLEAGDGLGLRAHGMERHGRSSRVRW